MHRFLSRSKPAAPPPPAPVLEPHGYLHATGAFTGGCRGDMHGVLAREAERARQDSPASRIIVAAADGSGGLLVVTTTEHLAHRLGRALQRAFGGDLHHGFGNGNRRALVWWRC